jgi:CBS domain containing-hemolysin-like protein
MTILIGNNLVNIGATALATQLTIKLFGNEFIGIMTGVLTFFVLVFGEVTPKRLAFIYNDFICLHTARMVNLLRILFSPFIWAIGLLSSGITRLFSRKNRKPISMKGIIQMMNIAENLGIIEHYETKMVKSVFRFNDVSIKAIMTHRTEVFSLEMDLHISEVLKKVTESGFARIPVYDKDPEKITGIVLTKEIMKHVAKENYYLKLKELMLSPIFVSETKKINSLFTLLKKEKLNLAVVLDEYGGLAGIVTLEDVVEEIFGELYDENEKKESEKIIPIKNGDYLLRADTSLHQINDFFGINLTEGKYDKTLGGYIAKELERIPEKNEILNLKSGKLVIEKVSKNRVKMVRYIPQQKGEKEKK